MQSHAANLTALLILLSRSSVGADLPILTEPGTTNAPGPALEQSLGSFKWQPVEGAAGYRISIRDLDDQQVDDVRLPPTTTFNQTELIAGHRYVWHVSAQFVSNSVTSLDRYFTVAVKPVCPAISGIAPNPIPAIHGAQVLLINGKEFRRGCKLILRDKTTGEQWDNLKQAVRRMNQIVVTPNFARAEGPWSVEVTNPGGYSSGEFSFPVVAPERIPKWNWLHSGEPWAYVALAGFCIATGGGLWSHFRLRPQRLAALSHRARTEERERFKRDLHDRTSADVSYLALLADRFSHDALAQNPEAQRRIHEIYRAARDVEMAIADLVWAADPENENLPQLASRLHDRIRERLKRENVEPDFGGWPARVPNVPITAEISREALYLSHEVLNNVTKHARATKLFCALNVNDGFLVLALRDNGIGFNANGQNAGRQGLANMCARAEMLGGSVNIRSSPGQGAEILITLPLRSESCLPTKG